MAKIFYPDDELIRRDLNGVTRAFGELVNRHQEHVFSYLLTMVKDRILANDLFQNTWYNAIRALKKCRGVI